MERASFAIYRLVTALLGRLPITVVFRLGWFFGSLGYYLAPTYRRLVLRNLTIAFGREKSPLELRNLARRHFATLVANLFSSIKFARLSSEEIRSLVTVEGLETIQAGNLAKRGFVMVVSHLGNWEMFPRLTPLIFGCKVGAIFQALGNRLIDADVRRQRAIGGFELFERKEGFAQACRVIRAGGAVGVLTDQHAGDAGLWCPFFGRLASTSPLAATLALRTGAWIVPAAVYTEGVARWRCVFLGQLQDVGNDPEVITMRINAVLEEQIRRKPEDWFWVHSRWKTPNPKFLLASYKRGVALPVEPHSAQELQPFRMLVRSSNWLGDAVMSVPAVLALKSGRPDARVTILTPAKLAGFWKSVRAVDEVLAIESKESVFDVARRIRGKFEAAVLFPNSLRVALEVWLAGVPRRAGYPGHSRRALLSSVIGGKKSKAKEIAAPGHQLHHDLALAKYVGADISGIVNAPLVPQKTKFRDKPVLALCPGAEYGAAKRWLPERFADAMRRIHEATDCEWRIFGIENDRPIADLILSAIEGIPCTDLVGRTTLAQLIEELSGCDLLLTNDTGTMHLAAHLGVPVVALFGSTEPALTGPLGPTHRVIRHHVDCSPCFLRECPLDFRCMRAIEVPEVVTAALATLRNGAFAKDG